MNKGSCAPIRLCTVGCGFFSQFHHEAWRRLQVDHVGICDLDRERARRFSREYGDPPVYDTLAQMLEHAKPDLLDIILPPRQHLETITLAASRGVDVICQKPFTLDRTQAEQALTTCERAGVRLIVHENFRFQPWYRHIAHLLGSGFFGELYQLRFDLRPGDGQGSRAYLDRQPYFRSMKRFLIHETGIHWVDTFRFLLGEPVSVWADLRQLNGSIRGEDAGMFVLDFPGGTRAVFDANRLSDHSAQNRRLTMGTLRVEGEAGTLDLDGNGRLHWREHGSNTATELDYTWSDRGFGGDCVFELQHHVIEHLLRGSPLENTAASYLRNLDIESAIYESDQRGSRITL